MNFRKNLGGAISAVLVAGALGIAVPAAAQTAPGAGAPSSQRELDFAAMEASRKAAVGANMNLTPDEATAFWPVFDQYEAKMDKLEMRHAAELKEFAKRYDNLTEADAKQKLDEVMAIAQGRLDVQKDFVGKFRAAIPQVKVTRFYQIDNKIRAMVQCQLAQIVPLAKGAGE